MSAICDSIFKVGHFMSCRWPRGHFLSPTAVPGSMEKSLGVHFFW